ncbi:hypothetical protein ACFQ1S_02660 [Kibdelosporangium lantanae]|uniref:Alpha/beta hydrolase n=1 Tax=Kibdelosporangium lantanae TaxID=1497396 RepID=A0ABW3M3T3_9PSEU
MTSIVGVHGIHHDMPEYDPVTAAAKIGETWSVNLAKGMGVHVPVKMAYYAPHLRRATSQAANDDPQSLDDEAREMLAAWDAEYREHLQVPQGAATVVPRQLISGMARLGGFASAPFHLFAMGMMREVPAYLRGGPQRQAAREEVAKTIQNANASVVLAHSLGSVVAYEALWAWPDITVDLLVTFGSPLGIRGFVFDRLVPKPVEVGLRPPGVRRWVNIADKGDVCAVPRWLRRSFEVDEDVEDTIHKFAFHKAARYLAAPAMTKTVERAL